MKPNGSPQGLPIQPSSPQAGVNRREALSLLLRVPIVATAGAVSMAMSSESPGDIHPTAPPRAEPIKEKPINLLGAPSAEAWETGELSLNWLNSLMQCYATLDKHHVAFIDQNGGLIGGEYIPIPKALLDTQNRPGFKDRFGHWVNLERAKLKEKYPTIYHNDDQEEPTLVSVRLVFDSDKEKSFLDAVSQNAKKPVSKSIHTSRYEYMQQELKKSDLPAELQTIAMGLVGIESRYLDMRPNSVGASGAFQIMPDEARNSHPPLITTKSIETRVGRGAKKKTVKKSVTIDDREKFEKALPVFIDLFRRRYMAIKNNDAVKEIQNRFGVTEKDIVYPLILNAYHSGLGRNVTGYSKPGGKKYDGMCKWFLKEFPRKTSVEGLLGKGPYGEDIFNLMVTLYSQNEVDPHFKTASRGYYRKARAMAELLNMRQEGREFGADADDKNEYKPPVFPDLVPPLPSPSLSDIERAQNSGHTIDWKRVGLFGVTAAAAHMVGEKVGDPHPVSRRRALATIASLARGGATLLASASAISLGGVLSRKRSETASLVAQHTEQRKVDVAYRSIPRRDEVGVRMSLQKILESSSLTPHAKKEDITPLNAGVIFHSMKDSLKRSLLVAQQKGLEAFDKDEEIKNGAHMVAVNPEGSLLRLRGVGIANDSRINDNALVSAQNDKDFAYLRDFAVATVDEIALDLNQKLINEYGMPSRFRVRMVSTSMSRSRSYQAAVRKGHPGYAARNDSPHIYGNTFDLSRFRYDIIDTESDTYCTINVNSPLDSVENKFSLVRTINAVLARILLEKREKGEISIIHEGANPVYHISVIPG